MGTRCGWGRCVVCEGVRTRAHTPTATYRSYFLLSTLLTLPGRGAHPCALLRTTTRRSPPTPTNLPIPLLTSYFTYLTGEGLRTPGHPSARRAARRPRPLSHPTILTHLTSYPEKGLRTLRTPPQDARCSPRRRPRPLSHPTLLTHPTS